MSQPKVTVHDLFFDSTETFCNPDNKVAVTDVELELCDRPFTLLTVQGRQMILLPLSCKWESDRPAQVCSWCLGTQAETQVILASVHSSSKFNQYSSPTCLIQRWSGHGQQESRQAGPLQGLPSDPAINSLQPTLQGVAPLLFVVAGTTFKLVRQFYLCCFTC